MASRALGILGLPPLNELGRFSWLFGPKRIWTANGCTLRAYSVPASTIFALMDAMNDHYEAHKEKNPGWIVGGAELMDASSGTLIPRARVSEMHEYQLRHLQVRGAGHSVSFRPGERPAVEGIDGPLREKLANLIEQTARPLPVLRRLWALATWLPALFAVVVLVIAGASGNGFSIMFAVGLLLVAVAAGTAGTVAVLRALREVVVSSVVHPYRWTDVVSRRARVLIAMISIAVGAGATILAGLLTGLVSLH